MSQPFEESNLADQFDSFNTAAQIAEDILQNNIGLYVHDIDADRKMLFFTHYASSYPPMNPIDIGDLVYDTGNNSVQYTPHESTIEDTLKEDIENRVIEPLTSILLGFEGNFVDSDYFILISNSSELVEMGRGGENPVECEQGTCYGHPVDTPMCR